MKYDNTNRESKSIEHKKEIIAAAKKLILEKGYDQVSVQDVTELAGVSKGAFYIHFKTKDDLIQSLIGDVFDDIKRQSGEKDVAAAVEYFLTESVKKIVEAGLKVAQLWFSDAAKSSVYGKVKLNYDVQSIKEILEKKYSDEQASDKALRIVAIYYGILLSWCISDGAVDPVEMMKKSIGGGIKAII